MSAAGNNPNPKVITTLVKAGLDVNAQDDLGETALMQAAGGNDNPQVVMTLLKAGADGKAKSNNGKTAFDYAQDNEKLKGTNAYWKLNEAQYRIERKKRTGKQSEECAGVIGGDRNIDSIPVIFQRSRLTYYQWAFMLLFG